MTRLHHLGVLTVCLALGAALGSLWSASGCCPAAEGTTTGVYRIDVDGDLSGFELEAGTADVQRDQLTVEYRLEDGREYVAVFERVGN